MFSARELTVEGVEFYKPSFYQPWSSATILPQALTWLCLSRIRHVDHRRIRLRTSAVPARRIELGKRPQHLGRSTRGVARRQAGTAASEPMLQLSILIRHLDQLTVVSQPDS
jgi:hypothetical protein